MSSNKICSHCGTQRKPKLENKGSFGAEVFIWFICICLAFVFIPILLFALAYSLWRLFSDKKLICRECGAPNMVPVDSPRGQAIASYRQMHNEVGTEMEVATQPVYNHRGHRIL